MTREQVQTAIQEGIPFLIKMADGEKYPEKGSVPRFIAFLRKKAVEKDRSHTFTYFAESLVLLEGKWIKS